MPHLADKLLTPSRLSAEGVLFEVPLRAYPGKPIVCMVSREVVLELGDAEHALPLLIPEEVADKYQPDFGVVARFTPRRDASGEVLYRCDLELRPGMLVAV